MFLTNDQFSAFFQNFASTNNQFAHAFQNLVPANDQLANVVKANLQKQITFLTSLSDTAVDSVTKVTELNINACKASLEDSKVVAAQLLAPKTPQDALQLLTAQQQPTLAKLTAYNRHLADIASGAQTAFSTTIQEQARESSRQLTEMVDAAAKNAPAGSEDFVTMAKAMIANASVGYAHLNKTTQQATEVIQANMAASVAQANQVAEQLTATVARARK